MGSNRLVRRKPASRPLPQTLQHQITDVPSYFKIWRIHGCAKSTMVSFSPTRNQHFEATGDIHVNAEVHTSDLQKAGKKAMRAVDENVQSCSGTIAAYLMERVEEFRELSELRQKGWNSQEGDRFFEEQRRVADNSDTKTAKYFYIMMQKIGKQLHRSTGALNVSGSGATPGRILDLCMAPGGFLNVALTFNQDSSALAFSLPPSSGGHEVLLPTDPNVAVNLLDITMLAADMGVTDTRVDHPDAENFLPPTFLPDHSFDLILCDGQVLRTHTRASYREATEARRLAASQLALGLERVIPGGTMVVLLHRVELWSTVSLLHRLSKFSSLMLFKPTAGHTKRSPFYMVATKINPQHPEAELAIEKWKKIWKTATFGTQEEYETVLMEGDKTVEEVLEEFGSELIRLGKKIWRVQAKALADAPFIR